MPGATIRDVAREAGVSVSTVSRVFTRPELFREETRRKVHAAVAALNYSPNPKAASLTTGRTANIGLIVPNLANPLFPEMIKAAQHGAQDRGLGALLADSDDSASNEEKLLHVLAKDVDGLIVFSSLLTGEQIASVSGLRPMVFVNRDVPGQHCVLVDGPHAMAMLVHYLVNLGHTAAVYHPGPATSPVAHDRLATLRAAASEGGIELSEAPMGPATFESGSAAADALVRGSLPTAVLCFNDQMAMGLTARLIQLGVRVPEQVSVVGWGGTTVSGHTTPALTTLAVPLTELGRVAVEELLRAESGEQDAVPIALKATLLVRATTGRARE